MKIDSIDPQDLKLHPDAAKVPELPKDHPDFIAIVERIRAEGITDPIKCIRPDLVIVGGDILRAAKRLQIETVPVIWDDRAQPANALLDDLILRAHYSKGAKAYLAVLFLDKALDESRRHRLENLRKGQQTPDSALSALSGNAADHAEALGFSRRLIFQARAVRKLFLTKDTFSFSDDPDKIQSLKDYFEPRILGHIPDLEPMGLGTVLREIAYKQKHPDGDGHRNPEQLQLWNRVWWDMGNRFLDWDSAPQSAKAETRAHRLETYARLPDSFLEDEIEDCKKALKARRAKSA